MGGRPAARFGRRTGASGVRDGKSPESGSIYSSLSQRVGTRCSHARILNGRLEHHVVPSIAETCQYFGIPVLGSTFDVLDYLMYAAGALTAVVVDRELLARAFRWWA